MSDNGEIQVDSKVIERLKRSIIIKENMNLKTRTMNDSQMVVWIKTVSYTHLTLPTTERV